MHRWAENNVWHSQVKFKKKQTVLWLTNTVKNKKSLRKVREDSVKVIYTINIYLKFLSLIQWKSFPSERKLSILGSGVNFSKRTKNSKQKILNSKMPVLLRFIVQVFFFPFINFTQKKIQKCPAQITRNQIFNILLPFSKFWAFFYIIRETVCWFQIKLR